MSTSDARPAGGAAMHAPGDVQQICLAAMDVRGMLKARATA